YSSSATHATTISLSRPERVARAAAAHMAATPAFMSAEPRPYRQPLRTSAPKASCVIPSASTTSRCPLNMSTGPPARPMRATRFARPLSMSCTSTRNPHCGSSSASSRTAGISPGAPGTSEGLRVSSLTSADVRATASNSWIVICAGVLQVLCAASCHRVPRNSADRDLHAAVVEPEGEGGRDGLAGMLHGVQRLRLPEYEHASASGSAERLGSPRSLTSGDGHHLLDLRRGDARVERPLVNPLLAHQGAEFGDASFLQRSHHLPRELLHALQCGSHALVALSIGIHHRLDGRTRHAGAPRVQDEHSRLESSGDGLLQRNALHAYAAAELQPEGTAERRGVMILPSPRHAQVLHLDRATLLGKLLGKHLPALVRCERRQCGDASRGRSAKAR